MTVTQVLMGAGSWSVTFNDQMLPQSIRDQILPLDHIAIGPPGLLDAGLSDANIRSTLKAAGGYMGVILEMPDSQTLSGCDLSWWLGDAEGRGPLTDTAIVRTTSTTTSVWLDQFLPTNGITKGTVTNGTSFSGVTSPMATDLELLNWVCENADTEWQMRPDGTVDVGPSTTLFPAPTTTSARIITKDDAADEGSLAGVEAVRLDRSRDATGVVSRVVVFHSADTDEVKFATATQTPTGVRWKDVAGSTPTARSLRAAGSVLKATQASAVASRMVGRISVDQKEAMLTSRTYNVTSEVSPGSRVWVHDYPSGLYDTANQVVWRGEVINPIQMRVHSLTWPIEQGMGVYVRLDGGATWIDLTPYVQFEDGDVTWEVTISGRKRNRAPIATGLVEIPMGNNAARTRQGFFDLTGRSSTSARVGGWTPVWTNFTIGTGGSAKNEGSYTFANGVLELQLQAALGNTSWAVGGSIQFDLPTGYQLRGLANDAGLGAPFLPGQVRMTVAGVLYEGALVRVSATRLRIFAKRVNGTYLDYADTSATIPNNWAAGNWISIVAYIPAEPT